MLVFKTSPVPVEALRHSALPFYAVVSAKETRAISAKYMAAEWDPALHSIELLHILRPCGNSRYKPPLGFFVRILIGESLV